MIYVKFRLIIHDVSMSHRDPCDSKLWHLELATTLHPNMSVIDVIRLAVAPPKRK